MATSHKLDEMSVKFNGRPQIAGVAGILQHYLLCIRHQPTQEVGLLDGNNMIITAPDGQGRQGAPGQLLLKVNNFVSPQ